MIILLVPLLFSHTLFPTGMPTSISLNPSVHAFISAAFNVFVTAWLQVCMTACCNVLECASLQASAKMDEEELDGKAHVKQTRLCV